MPKTTKPRSGSMGVWPRKRAKRLIARVRNYTQIKEPKLLGFAAYKAGMTHTMVIGQDKKKIDAGVERFTPVTILECPPLKIASARFYKKEGVAHRVVKQINFKVDKELSRAQNVNLKKSNEKDLDNIKSSDYDDVRVQVYTVPKNIGLKKTPEIFEIQLGGSLDEKLEFIKKHQNTPIKVSDIFKEGEIVDAHAVTTGKGFKGPMKRFGIGRTSHKSEKSRRTPGSMGPWRGWAHWMFRVPKAGQTGFHQRLQNNNLIMKISDNPEDINPKGGFIRYGEVGSTYVMIKGSLPGPKKRLITLTYPVKGKKKSSFSSDSITHISKESKQ